MAEQIPQEHAKNTCGNGKEAKEQGCFDFLREKEEKSEDVAMKDLSTKQEKRTLLNTHSHSSSSSDEGVDDGGERKKIKGLKDDEEEEEDGIPISVEKCSEETEGSFLDKIKDKLLKKVQDDDDQDKTPLEAETDHSPKTETGTKEKKGIIDKIKGKFNNHQNEEEAPHISH